mmetsp:Transcript_22933/g.38564  ORF Transcript_22933/g.38564 Transcript_22933/m.38564 type:complete len:781 (+) Transcript_22933:3585-5927(+)
MNEGGHSPQRKLPFKTQPDIDQNRANGQDHGQSGGLDQLARDLWPNGFDRHEFDVRHRHGHGRLHVSDRVGRYGLLAFLGLNADHRHVLIRVKRGVKHFGDRNIAQLQRRHRIAVNADIDRLRAFCADRGAAPEIDAKVQALNGKGRKSNDHHQRRNPQPDLPAAKEIERGVLADKLQAHLLDLDGFRAAAFIPHHHNKPRHENRGKDGCQNAQAQRDRKAPHRARAHGKQDHSGNERGDVGVDNGTQRLLIAQFNRPRRPLGRFQLFADPLEHQHIGVNGHAHREDDSRNPRQGQRRPDEGQKAKDQPDIDDQRDIRKQTKQAIAQPHEHKHRTKSDHGRDLARINAVLPQFGANGAFLKKSQFRRQSAGAQQHRKICRFLDIKLARNNARPTRDVALDHRGADHLVIQYNGKGGSDIIRCIIAKGPRPTGVKAERDGGRPVLVKAGLRIDKILARHHRRAFDHVKQARFVQRRHDLVAHTRRLRPIRRAADNGVKGQLGCGPDDLFQLRSRPNTRHLDQDALCALALNGWLAGAHFVNAAAHNLQRLLHGALVAGQPLRIAQRHDDHIAIGADLNVVCANAGQGLHRTGQTPDHLQRALHPALFTNANAQLVRGRRLQTDGTNGLPLRAQRIANFRPGRLHPAGINIRHLHFGQQMGPAPQVQTKVHEAGGHPRRPLRQKRLVLGGIGPQFDRLGGIIVLFHPGVKPVGQRQYQTKGTSGPDQDPFPRIELQHYLAGSVLLMTDAMVDWTTRTLTPSASSTSISLSSLTLATLPIRPP